MVWGGKDVERKAIGTTKTRPLEAGSRRRTRRRIRILLGVFAPLRETLFVRRWPSPAVGRNQILKPRITRMSRIGDAGLEFPSVLSVLSV